MRAYKEVGKRVCEGMVTACEVVVCGKCACQWVALLSLPCASYHVVQRMGGPQSSGCDTAAGFGK